MSSEIFLGEISSNTEQLCGKFHLKLHAFVGNNADKIVHFCIVTCVLPLRSNRQMILIVFIFCYKFQCKF